MNNLHLSAEAQADLEKIKEYITVELENPAAAIAVIKRITKTIRILQQHALAGAALSSIANIESDYRFLVSGHYLIFYRVSESDVYIDRVLYGRRDYLRILFGESVEDEST